MRRSLAWFAIGTSTLAALLASCGGGDESEPEPSATSRPATATRPAGIPTITGGPETPTVEAGETPASTAVPAATATTAPPPTQAPPPPPPPPTQPPPPPPPPATVSLTVVASSLRFSPSTLTAPAGAQITATIDNRDDGTPHDLTFRDSSGTTIASTEIFNGPGQRSVTFTPAAAGQYGYVCTVHPQQMRGTLTVQ